MTRSSHSPAATSYLGSDFKTTHWSVVLQAGRDSSSDATAALEKLCRAYWYPIYVYVRRQGHAAHDAQDLTQEFFAQLLRLRSLGAVAPHKGKFRTFLLVSLKHFLSDARDAARAQKRGGGRAVLSLDEDEAEHRYAADLAVTMSPESLFDRRWALTLLNNALLRSEAEFTAADKTEQFSAPQSFLPNEALPGVYDS